MIKYNPYGWIIKDATNKTINSGEKYKNNADRGELFVKLSRLKHKEQVLSDKLIMLSEIEEKHKDVVCQIENLREEIRNLYI